MKILVFGANGMLGKYVCNYLSKYYEIIPITRNEYNIETADWLKLNSIIEQSNSNILINCAGLIPQRNHENKSAYYIINTLFPIVLSIYCNNNNIKMIHITTDCVFSGNTGNYIETSIHDETNDYGISKSLGELCINTTIIRTSIIGNEQNNKKSLLEWVISNKNNTINGYDNHYWNGVTCLELSKIIYEIINKQLYWNGIQHIFSQKTVSKYELIEMINTIYNLKINILKCLTEKTINKSLFTNNTVTNFLIPDIKDQLIELFDYNNNNFVR